MIMSLYVFPSCCDAVVLHLLLLMLWVAVLENWWAKNTVRHVVFADIIYSLFVVESDM